MLGVTPLKLAGRRVTVLGLAREGTALARYLAEQGAEVTVSDLKSEQQLAANLAQLSDLPICYILGGHPPEILDAEILFVSPGIPLESPIVVEAVRRGVALSSESRLTTRLIPAPVLGITGSSGKTTTTALVGEMLVASGITAFVGGNIGRPLLSQIAEMTPASRAVMELSSFQLELFGDSLVVGGISATLMPPGGWSPHVAAVLNLTPNHLDRHPSMEAYAAAKANILLYQGEDDYAVLNADDPWASRLATMCRGRVFTFSSSHEVEEGAFRRGKELVLRVDGREAVFCREDEIRLRGAHNRDNILAASAIAALGGATVEGIGQIARTFAGVPHRLELVREWRGVRYYNDSIATSPERSMAALRSFDEPIVLLAGGRDKHLPWEEWAALVREKVACLILFGEAANLIKNALGQGGPTWHQVATMEEAVVLASRLARPGQVVLLSPGGTSFDAYRDYEERGDIFRSLVRSLS